ncbi:hypothetical protein ALC57_12100 [Trachymyrmex cornetzi]|uniref:Uncharacterized protein n=1 Tax=Trachymyrmex cornetzi TaxID=471704 RepID=A0A151J1B7_9HYME|nr:hypothetical protein ALC57_12100 [Trachymyrmex cornetzi]
MHAGCWVELPREIMLKKAVINVRSMDNVCFAWSVVAVLYPAEKNVNRKSSYPDYTTVLKLEGIEFPVTLKQITKFEFLNDISINVFTERERGGKKRDDGNEIVPLRLTKEKKEKLVNLLYLQDSRRNDENVIGHFTWIKNLSRLTGSQLSKSTKKKNLCDSKETFYLILYTSYIILFNLHLHRTSRLKHYFRIDSHLHLATIQVANLCIVRQHMYRIQLCNANLPSYIRIIYCSPFCNCKKSCAAKFLVLEVLHDTKRIKGVKKNVVAKTFTFDDYVRCLNDVMVQSRRQSCIRSTLH